MQDKERFGQQRRKTLKYPKAVAFIISNEFCERFNFYGLRTILVLYLTTKLHYEKDSATVLYHIFSMIVYMCPLIGAIIADSWLGKFKTILYLSILYAIGCVIVSIGAIATLNLPVKALTIIGLLCIAFGTGGIKPCVSAFGGDQFRLPQQAAQLATFFSLFYFAINAGSTISTTITPILREDVHCFGESDCFSLAFGVPAMLMLLSVVIFIAGKRLYIIKPSSGNMIFGVTTCLTNAVTGWFRERKTNPRKHWLDYAEPKSGHKMVFDTKILIRILVLYLPFPLFWALFDQQGSRWTFQATRLDGETFGYYIKPDQVQVVNPLFVMAFIPLFNYVVYPLLSKIGIRRPLQKLALGGILAAAAFIISAFLQMKIEATEPQPLGPKDVHLRIYNGMKCDYRFRTDFPVEKGGLIKSLDMWEDLSLKVDKIETHRLDASSKSNRCPDVTGEFKLVPGKALSFFIAHDGVHQFEDSNLKHSIGSPLVRVLLNIPVFDEPISIMDPANKPTDLKAFETAQVVTLLRGTSVLQVSGKTVTNITTKDGGVYVLMVNGNINNGFTSKIHTITKPNSIHIMWQLPQYMIITAAEIMFSVTGLEFSFTQAPLSMKSVLQACWQLSVAIGNMLVVVIAELKFFESQTAEFALFAALMIVDMLIFMLLAKRYNYVEHTDDIESSKLDSNTPTITSGTDSYSSSESLSNRSRSSRSRSKSKSNDISRSSRSDVSRSSLGSRTRSESGSESYESVLRRKRSKFSRPSAPRVVVSHRIPSSATEFLSMHR